MCYDERVTTKRFSSLIPRKASFTTNSRGIPPSLNLCFLVVEAHGYEYHFGRDIIRKGKVKVLKIPTAYNPADIFTEVLRVYNLREALKMLQIGKE